MVCAESSNCRPSSSGERPERASSMSRARSCGGYGGRVFGIVDSFLPPKGSTEPGQVQICPPLIEGRSSRRCGQLAGVVIVAEVLKARAEIGQAVNKQTDRDDGRRADGLTTEEREEVRRLRREVKALREERESLKKAAAWFARETGSIPGKDSSS
jgi:hypothetical protein